MTLIVPCTGTNVAPTYDLNKITWSGFHSTSEEAEKHLQHQLDKLSNEHIIISAKSQFVNRHFKGYFLYRYHVIVAPLSA
jgi:hypothetical protein